MSIVITCLFVHQEVKGKDLISSYIMLSTERKSSTNTHWIRREHFYGKQCIDRDLNYESFKKVHGETGDVDDSVLRDWKKSVLDDILKQYKHCNIFNIDEYGIFPTKFSLSRMKNV